MKEQVRNTVYELRAKENITQEDLAEAIGVTRQTVIAIEKGELRALGVACAQDRAVLQGSR